MPTKAPANSIDTPERLPFKIHPRVFKALGADLVTNDVVAIIELVNRARLNVPILLQASNDEVTKVSVSERRGLSGTRIPQTFHIPYIPPKSMVTGTLSCAISTYSYGYQAYGERDIYMSATPIAEHSRLDEEGIKKMLATNPDLSTDSYDFSGSKSYSFSTSTSLVTV